MRRLGVLALILLLTGCARATWQKPGGSVADFEQDKAACRFAVSASADPIFAALHTPDCLRGKGWTLVKD